MRSLNLVLVATAASLLCLLFPPDRERIPAKPAERVEHLWLSVAKSEFPGFTVAGLKPGDSVSSMSPEALSKCRWEDEYHFDCANLGFTLDRSRRFRKLWQYNTLKDVLLEKGGRPVNVDRATLTTFLRSQSDCLITEQLPHSIVVECRGSRLTVEYRYPESELFQVTLEKLLKSAY